MNLQERLKAIDVKVTMLEARREERARALVDLEKELTDLDEEANVLTLTEQTLLHISTKILGQSTGTIDKLVTAGLKIVFDDQNLEFRTLTDKARGKTAIKFQILHDGRTVPLIEGYGGGVLCIVGVLLRVVTIMALGMRRVLFLDETLSHLAVDYVDHASKLLKKICAELDFVVVMVSHQPEFASHADRHYTARRVGGATIIEKASSGKGISREA